MAASIKEQEIAHDIAEGRLDSTRDELRRMMERADARRAKSGYFPRSKTMRMITNGKLTTLLAIGAGGFLLLRPGVFKTALRVLPVQSIVKMLAIKYLSRGR